MMGFIRDPQAERLRDDVQHVGAHGGSDAVCRVCSAVETLVSRCRYHDHGLVFYLVALVD